jgi:uncharacterized protein (DUF2141 family)
VRKSIILLGLTALVSAAEITINVQGLRNSDGEVLMALYDSKAKYETNDRKDGLGIYAPIKAQKSTYTFKDVKPGNYALTFFHDENSNADLDFHFFGFPLEGYAFSNNVFPMFRGASFEEAMIEVKEGESLTFDIEMNYLF